MWKLIRRVLLALLVIAVVLNWTWARLPADPPLPPGSHFVTVDGKKIHFVEKAGSEPAVVMIHGLPGTWGDWDDVARVNRGQRMIQIDRPGYAFSQAGYVPFDQQVELIHDLAKKLKLKDPVIAGHSYGGSIALMYARRFASDVSGVVAVDPAVDPNGVTLEREIQARFTRLMRLPVLKQLGNLTVSNLVRKLSGEQGGKDAFEPDPVSDAWLDRTLSLTMRERDLDAWSQEVLAGKDAIASVAGVLDEIRAPVWFIQGDQDNLVSPSAVESAAKTVPGAKLKMLPGGHMQPYTHPEVVARNITAASR